VIVDEVDDRRCHRCGDRLGVGFTEEPTGWKVYGVCLDAETSSHDRWLGTVSRGSIGHVDEVAERAEHLVRSSL